MRGVGLVRAGRRMTVIVVWWGRCMIEMVEGVGMIVLIWMMGGRVYIMEKIALINVYSV